MGKEFTIKICTDPVNCEGCELFLRRLRSTPKGSEAVYDRFDYLGILQGDPFPGCDIRACATDGDGIVIGVATGQSVSGEVGAIVDPKHHREGLGNKLTKKVLDQLRRQGTRIAHAKIKSRNEPSKGLFAKVFGFKRNGEPDEEGRVDYKLEL